MADSKITEKKPLLTKTRFCHVGYLPARYVLVFWTFFGFVLMNSFRFQMNVTILAMTGNRSDVSILAMTSNRSDPILSNKTKENYLTDFKETSYNWASHEVNLILGSFFWGYISTEIIGGWLVSRFGGKWINGICYMFNSLLSIVTPVMADLGPTFVVINRVLVGVCQGILRTCDFEMWKSWAPRHEMGFLRGLGLSGGSIGAILATVLNAYICELFGWPVVFYFYGVMGLLWCLCWMTLIYETPCQHPRISVKEREYIMANLTHSSQKKEKIDLIKVIKSPTFWAPTIGNFSYRWVGLGMVAVLPTYLHTVLHLEISEIGIFSSFGSMVGLIANPLSGYVSDVLISRQILSIKNTRKVMISIGLFTPAVLTLLMCFTQNTAVTVMCIAVCVGIAEVSMLGVSSNYIDIGPNHSGMLFAVGNSVGSSAGFIGPAVLELISSHAADTLEMWRYFFITSLSIFVFGGLFFLLLAKEEPQQFSKLDDQTRECNS